MQQRRNCIIPTENMKQNLRIETFYVRPPVNTDEILDSLDWYHRSDAPVKASLTDWYMFDQFPDLCRQLNVLYRTIKSKTSGLHRMNVATTQKLITIVVLIGLLCGIWMPVLLAIRSVSQT